MTGARADGPHPLRTSLAQGPSPTHHAWHSPDQGGADLLHGDTRTALSAIPAPLLFLSRLGLNCAEHGKERTQRWLAMVAPCGHRRL